MAAGLILAGLALWLTAAPQAQAGYRIRHTHRFPHTKPRKPFQAPYDVIRSVNESAGTVTVGYVHSKNPDARVYRVTQFTDIEVSGAKGTLHDVKAGMKVDLTEGTDAAVADRMVLTPAK